MTDARDGANYEPVHITSRDNPLLKEIRKLSQDNTAYRKVGKVWLEGDHLLRAALDRGIVPAVAVFSESAWVTFPHRIKADPSYKIAIVADALYQSLSNLESPSTMGFVMDLPETTGALKGVATVVLDRVQDAGNVGSILRSAGAFGFGQVVAMKGTAALWSSKVIRAGMGAHFGLRLVEGADMEMLESLELPLVVTSSHGGMDLHDAKLPVPCAWVMGHEGQGVSPEIEQMAELKVMIAQPGGEESLNVAAAAAICLYASADRL